MRGARLVRLLGLMLAMTKGAFFDVLGAMIGGLMLITLILAFLYLVYGRERKRP